MLQDLSDESVPLALFQVICKGLSAIQDAHAALQTDSKLHAAMSQAEVASRMLARTLRNLRISINLCDVMEDLHLIAGSLELNLAEPHERELAREQIASLQFPRLQAHAGRFREILKSVEKCESLVGELESANQALGNPNPRYDGIPQRSLPYDGLFYAFANRLFDIITEECRPGQEIRLRLGTLWDTPPSDDDRSLDILFQIEDAPERYWLSLRLHSYVTTQPTEHDKEFHTTHEWESTTPRSVEAFSIFKRDFSSMRHKIVSKSRAAFRSIGRKPDNSSRATLKSTDRETDNSSHGQHSWRTKNAREFSSIYSFTAELGAIFRTFLQHISLGGSKRWLMHKSDIISDSEYYNTEYTLDTLFVKMSLNDTEKTAIAMQLAHALSYYYESGWLSGRWTIPSISFIQWGSRIPCKPWLKISMTGTPTDKARNSPDHDLHQLLELGVVLLELQLGQAMDLFLHLKPAKSTTERKAQAKQTYLGLISGGKISCAHYRRAINFCIETEISTVAPGSLREAIYRNVALPLYAAVSERGYGPKKLEAIDLGQIRRNSSFYSTIINANAAPSEIPVPGAPNLAGSQAQRPEPPRILTSDDALEEPDLFTTEEALEPDKDRSKASDEWLKAVKGVIRKHIQADSTSTRRVKVALLDTGIDIKHSYFEDQYPNGNIKSIRSWVDGNEGVETPNGGDDCGHGTFIASLLLDLGPTIDLYVARVNKSKKLEKNAAANVASALQHARESWGVDIITMSFGFPDNITEIEQQIYQLSQPQRNILMFAAASNEGRNRRRAYPARNRSVFAIHSTNAKGIKSDFNPPARGDENFSILGECIQSAWLTSDSSACTRRLSGTSFATPIAVCVAAFLLAYVPQVVPDHDTFFHKIQSYDGMRGLLQELVPIDLADESSKYQYLALERFLNSNEKTPAAIREAFKKALTG